MCDVLRSEGRALVVDLSVALNLPCRPTPCFWRPAADSVDDLQNVIRRFRPLESGWFELLEGTGDLCEGRDRVRNCDSCPLSKPLASTGLRSGAVPLKGRPRQLPTDVGRVSPVRASHSGSTAGAPRR